jgi:hypothetical protein
MKNTPSKTSKVPIGDYWHPKQNPKKWKVTRTNRRVAVSFPAGLFEIVPVAWCLHDFINDRYCDLPNMHCSEEGTRATHQINAGSGEGTGEFDEDGDEIMEFPQPEIVEFKNEGTQVFVTAKNKETADKYAWQLLVAIIREKYRTITFLDRYKEKLKRGRIKWQFYNREDDYTVMLLPKKAKKYLKLKAAQGVVIKPLSYELEGFVALHADSKKLAKEQAEQILRWLYKIPKPAKKPKASKRNKRSKS